MSEMHAGLPCACSLTMCCTLSDALPLVCLSSQSPDTLSTLLSFLLLPWDGTSSPVLGGASRGTFAWLTNSAMVSRGACVYDWFRCLNQEPRKIPSQRLRQAVAPFFQYVL